MFKPVLLKYIHSHCLSTARSILFEPYGPGNLLRPPLDYYIYFLEGGAKPSAGIAAFATWVAWFLRECSPHLIGLNGEQLMTWNLFEGTINKRPST